MLMSRAISQSRNDRRLAVRLDESRNTLIKVVRDLDDGGGGVERVVRIIG